jgi:O-antigen ligase
LVGDFELVEQDQAINHSFPQNGEAAIFIEPVKSKIPFNLKMVIIYLFLLFLIMPAAFGPREATGLIQEQTIGRQAVPFTSIFHRLPLPMGVAMLAISLLTKRQLRGMTLPTVLFSVFSCGYIINGIWGPAGFIESIRLFFATTSVGLCLVLTIRKPSHLNYFLKAIMAVSLANALYGLLFTVPGLAGLGESLKSLGLPSGRDHSEWRLVGLLGDPTNCGLLLIFGFLIIMDRIFDKIQTLNLFFGMIFVLAIFLTFSRTTWFGTLAGVIFSLMWQKKIAPRKILLLSIIGGLFVLLAHGIFSFSIQENQFRWNIAQSDTRSGVWLFWLGMALKHPLGYGIGSIYEYVNLRSWQVPHNIYLSIWVEAGIQSLIPLLLLLWISFSRLWRVRRYVNPQTGKNYGALLLSLLVAISVSLFALSSMMQLLFIAMGLCFSACLLAQDGLLAES